eukprot:9483682-Pyramimonas_sp.AAC.1
MMIYIQKIVVVYIQITGTCKFHGPQYGPQYGPQDGPDRFPWGPQEDPGGSREASKRLPGGPQEAPKTPRGIRRIPAEPENSGGQAY